VSDLRRAAGLSSSSALVVGIAAALVRRGGIEETTEWQRAIRSDQHLAWYLGCVENGMDFPGLPGAAGVGTRGGSEDHTAILTCKAAHLSLYRYVPVARLADVAMPGGWTFLVGTSGVRAEKSGAARERYNRLSRAAQAIVSIWNEASGTPAPSLAAALDMAGGFAPLRAIIARSARGEFSREVLARRLTHFVREDARVADAAHAFAAGDRSRIAGLAAGTQHDANELLRNQTDETRALADEGIEAGAWAASSFGAGFGGSVWALAAESDAMRVLRKWMSRYLARYPSAVETEWLIARPGPGVTVI
jgi:galactokinase